VSLVRQLDAKLEGAPNYLLTTGLIVAGIIAWIIGIFGNPTTKAAVLAWMVFP